MKFRKKPVVIEAVRYEGHGNFKNSEVPSWVWAAFQSGVLKPVNGDDPILVQTIEGVVNLKPGAWLIRGVEGELYPCAPEIFEKTYEAV